MAKVNIEGFQQPRITRKNTSFNLFIHFYVDRSYQFDWFKQRLFFDEAQGHMRRRKETK